MAGGNAGYDHLTAGYHHRTGASGSPAALEQEAKTSSSRTTSRLLAQTGPSPRVHGRVRETGLRARGTEVLVVSPRITTVSFEVLDTERCQDMPTRLYARPILEDTVKTKNN